MTYFARQLAFIFVLLAQSGRISVDVNLVVLHATVTDRQGRIVSSLGKEDFQIFEDGVSQSIQLFRHEDVPVTAGLVVDHSGSMRRKLAQVSAAARTFVENSNPQDRMFVVNFNEHVSMGLPDDVRFTADPAVLQHAIDATAAAGKTALYDAIVAALEQLKIGAALEKSMDKKVLLVISDGGDNASKHTLSQVLQLAEQSNAIIYTVGIFDEDDPDRNPKVLKTLASKTGGEAFFPQEVSATSAICQRIAHDIRNQYTLGYAPSRPARPGEYRSIRVVAQSPHHGKLTVRTRSGYLVPGEGQTNEDR